MVCKNVGYTENHADGTCKAILISQTFVANVALVWHYFSITENFDEVYKSAVYVENFTTQVM